MLISSDQERRYLLYNQNQIVAVHGLKKNLETHKKIFVILI